MANDSRIYKIVEVFPTLCGTEKITVVKLENGWEKHPTKEMLAAHRPKIGDSWVIDDVGNESIVTQAPA